MKALSFSESTYDKQYRRPTKSFSKGVPFIVHPMRVALILIEEIEMRDIGAIASALLHDVVETHRSTIGIADLEKQFGRPIAMLVSILTKPAVEADTEEEREHKLQIYYKRLEQASILSKVVKLADRLDTVREAPDWINRDEQSRYLEETRSIFLPLAEQSDTYLLEELCLACEQLEAAINGEGSAANENE